MADTNERLQQAIAAARAGNTDEARELVDGLVAENPDNPHALFLRGMLTDSEEEQLEYLNRVLEIDPNHKAANRRLEQIAPAAADDATVLIIDEPEEVEEPEAVEDFGTVATVVGAGALFADEDDLYEATSDEATSEEQASDDGLSVEDDSADDSGEWGAPETVVTAAAVGAGIEALDRDSTVVDGGFSEETYLEEGLAEEEAFDDGLDEAIMTAAVATGAVMAGDEDEDIPEWLMAETRSEEDLTAVSDQDVWAEAPEEPVNELPDWLNEEPADSWAQTDAEEATVFAASTDDESTFEDTWATELEDGQTQDDEMALDEGETLTEDMGAEDEETEEAVAEKPKKKSSTRGLEVALVVLISIALLIVIGLLYVLINPPF